MDRKPLNSSRIRSVGYDAGQQVLEIEFRDGKVEQYSRVPSEVQRRFLAAPSPDSFFRDRIEEDYTVRRVR